MWTIDRVAFTLIGQPIYWYGIVIALGVLLAYASAVMREKRVGVAPDTTINLSLFLIPVSLVFARAYYVAFAWDLYADDLLSVFDFRRGGMAIYGGVIGGALVVFFYGRAKKTSFLTLADLAAPSLALGQAIGRWGNFFNQEAYGIRITNAAFQFFPAAVWIEREGSWFAATFFYESIWCFIVFLALVIGERFRAFRRRGDIFLWYGLLYGCERTVVEGLRLDSLYVGAARVSQLVSLLAVAVCVFVLIIRTKKMNFRVAAAIMSLLCCAIAVPDLMAGASPDWLILPVLMTIGSAIWMYKGLGVGES